MTGPIEYAGLVAREGTPEQDGVLASLAAYGVGGIQKVSNPTSGRDDGVHPTRTSVVVCRSCDQGRSCVLKFYEDSESGRQSLRKHAMLLERLQGLLQVPGVIAAENDAGPLGLPTLITTFIGESADQAIHQLSTNDRFRLMDDFAEATAALSQVTASDVGLPSISLEDLVAQISTTFAEDSLWYLDQAKRPDCPSRELVQRGTQALANAEVAVTHVCLAHRDLTAYNIAVQSGCFSGIVDWDHGGIACREEDLGKATLGLMVTLPIPYDERVHMADRLVESYCACTSVTVGRIRTASVAFALDAALDWLVGGKNAPCKDLEWAVETILGKIV